VSRIGRLSLSGYKEAIYLGICSIYVSPEFHSQPTWLYCTYEKYQGTLMLLHSQNCSCLPYSILYRRVWWRMCFMQWWNDFYSLWEAVASSFFVYIGLGGCSIWKSKTITIQILIVLDVYIINCWSMMGQFQIGDGLF